jgi:hypothetical protein
MLARESNWLPQVELKSPAGKLRGQHEGAEAGLHRFVAAFAQRGIADWVKIKRDLENQVRGLLKNLGLLIGRGTFNVFTARAKELIADRPELTAAVSPRNPIVKQRPASGSVR